MRSLAETPATPTSAGAERAVQLEGAVPYPLVTPRASLHLVHDHQVAAGALDYGK